MSTNTGGADIPRAMRASVLVATGQVDLALPVPGRFDLDHAGEALNADLTPGLPQGGGPAVSELNDSVLDGLSAGAAQ